MNYDGLLNAATEIGYHLLYNGAEIYRVEESIQRIFKAYGVIEGDVFAVPSCLIVTICTDTEHPITKIKRLYHRRINLDKIIQLNELCRQICRETPDISFISRRITEINKTKEYNFWLEMFGFALVAFSFTLFYGGTLADALCAILSGAAVKIVYYNMNRFNSNIFFSNIISSAVATFIALIMVNSGFAPNPDKIIIGTLMNLVPGIAITTFMRDIISGDLFAGITKLMEALLIATAIALGSGIALTIGRLL
jgi:uncharacterized membrane protein YjjP (DUF1212 family)